MSRKVEERKTRTLRQAPDDMRSFLSRALFGVRRSPPLWIFLLRGRRGEKQKETSKAAKTAALQRIQEKKKTKAATIAALQRRTQPTVRWSRPLLCLYLRRPFPMQHDPVGVFGQGFLAEFEDQALRITIV